MASATKARTRGQHVIWSTQFRMDPNAKKNTLGQDAIRAQLQETGQKAKARLKTAIRNPAYSSRLAYKTYKKDGCWRIWIGTWSSFAHWEEFGAINWHGPIAPMRRTLHAMGLRLTDTAKNSEDAPS